MTFHMIGVAICGMFFRKSVKYFGYKYGIIMFQLCKVLGNLFFGVFTNMPLILFGSVIYGIGWCGFIILSSYLIMDIFQEHHNAFATSIVISGLGLSGFIWNYLLSYIINPHGIDPKILVVYDQLKELYFDETVANNTPTFWLIHAAVIFIGTAIIAPFIETIPEDYGIIPKKAYKMYSEMTKPKKSLEFSKSFKETRPSSINMYKGYEMEYLNLSVQQNLDHNNLIITPRDYSKLNTPRDLEVPIISQKILVTEISDEMKCAKSDSQINEVEWNVYHAYEYEKIYTSREF